MKISKKAMCFICAVMAVVALSSTVGHALSSSTKNIAVYTGVNIYIDDKKIDPTDVNGNPVEAFVYNGTTYLPVRALSEALGKPVQWEGKTSSVYVGKHSSDKPAVWLADMDYYTRTGNGFTRYTSEEDNLGDTHYKILGGFGGRSETFIINGQYTAISGVFFQPYRYRDDDDGTILEIYGDGELLYKASVRGGEQAVKPISFNVDITGVLELKVQFISENSYHPGDGVIGECGLWT